MSLEPLAVTTLQDLRRNQCSKNTTAFAVLLAWRLMCTTLNKEMNALYQNYLVRMKSQ